VSGDVGVGATGRIAVLSSRLTAARGGRIELTVFTSSGRLDPRFHGGRLVAVSTDPNGECCGTGGPFVTRDNGVAVGLVGFQDVMVRRYDAGGHLDWKGGWPVAAGSVDATLAGGSVRGLGADSFLSQFGPTPLWLLGLTPAGELDHRVGPAGTRTLSMMTGPDALVADAANRLYVVGNSYASAPSGRSMLIARMSSSGVVDSAYGVAGVTTIPVDDSDTSPGVSFGTGYGVVALAADGTLFIAGEATSLSTGKRVVVVRKIDPDGTLDSGFGVSGLAEIGGRTGSTQLKAITVDTNGRPILSILERGAKPQPAIVRLDATSGGLDSAFGLGGIVRVSGLVTGLAVAPNGKLLTVSRIAHNGQFVEYLARRNL
jgi:hypothetical protein